MKKSLLTILLSGLITAIYAQDVRIPTFTLDLKASREVSELLEKGKEEIMISVEVYGEPKKQIDPAAEQYLDDYKSYLYIASFRFMLDKAEKFVFENHVVPRLGLENLKDPDYTVSINVYSSRKSSKNNVLSASYVGDNISKLQGKTYQIKIDMLE